MGLCGNGFSEIRPLGETHFNQKRAKILPPGWCGIAQQLGVGSGDDAAAARLGRVGVEETKPGRPLWTAHSACYTRRCVFCSTLLQVGVRLNTLSYLLTIFKFLNVFSLHYDHCSFS